MADRDPNELSAEEEAALDTFMTTDNTVPEDPDMFPVPGAEAPAAAPAPAEAPAPAAPAPAAPAAAAPAPAPAVPAPAAAPAAPAQTEDERFAAWMAQNEGKTPEELAKLAFQQSQRAAAAGYDARQSADRLKSINERVAAAQTRAQEARAKVAIDRAAFQQRLADDPDAATAEIFERLAAAEGAGIDQAEFSARQDAAIEVARSAFPDFDERAPAMFGFGGEMGYTPQELQNISDPRDLVILGLAEVASRLLKGGLIDLSGNLLAAPQPVAEVPTDPRLAAQRPVGNLSSVPARPPAGPGNVAQQAVDVLQLSDADFDKLSASGELDSLMKQLVP